MEKEQEGRQVLRLCARDVSGKSENGQECGEHEGEDLARGTSHTGP